MSTVTRICQQCGKDYRTPERNRPKYCTIQCAGAANRNGEDRSCQHCGTTFYCHPSTPNRKYCSRSCHMSVRNAVCFNPSRERDISGERNPMFGRGRKGADNPMFGKRGAAAPRWTGGRKVRKDGYTLVVAPDDHPYPAYTKASGMKYILEHRHVVERRLGRYLLPTEVVHHIDHNPANNADANLELFASHAEHVKARHSPASSVGGRNGTRPSR